MGKGTEERRIEKETTHENGKTKLEETLKKLGKKGNKSDDGVKK